MLAGGCHCQQVRYEVDEPFFHKTNCHCTLCRRTSGAPLMTWFTVRRQRIRWVKGSPARYTSTDIAIRLFCRDCGTHLAFEHQRYPNETDVTVGSLDQPDAIAPEDDSHIADKLPWVRLDPSLPSYPGARPDDIIER